MCVNILSWPARILLQCCNCKIAAGLVQSSFVTARVILQIEDTLLEPDGHLDSFWRSRPDFDVSKAFIGFGGAAVGLIRYFSSTNALDWLLQTSVASALLVCAMCFGVYHLAAKLYSSQYQSNQRHWDGRGQLVCANRLVKACQATQVALARCRRTLRNDASYQQECSKLGKALHKVFVFQPEGFSVLHVPTLLESGSYYLRPENWQTLEQEI